RYRIMESFLSHFDADEYVDYVKKESYESGYDSGRDYGALSTTIKYYLAGNVPLDQALEDTQFTEEQFQNAVEAYKKQHPQGK
ncbi:MAG: hypothetical protein KBS85_00655, partial [Lachnospiraceae bacterium]|nr:hypothetical protein [Candidatus Merdinaster equi]